LYTTVIW